MKWGMGSAHSRFYMSVSVCTASHQAPGGLQQQLPLVQLHKANPASMHHTSKVSCAQHDWHGSVFAMLTTWHWCAT
jgi:hypothetical protein